MVSNSKGQALLTVRVPLMTSVFVSTLSFLESLPSPHLLQILHSHPLKLETLMPGLFTRL